MKNTHILFKQRGVGCEGVAKKRGQSYRPNQCRVFML